MKKIVQILVFIGFLISNAFSQGGSNYSIFGIGDQIKSIGAAYDGIAGTSIAIPSDYTINTNNPALWSFVTHTRLSAGYRFNQNYIESQNFSLYQNNGKIDGVKALFSIDTSLGISATFGVLPYSSVNYLISTPVFKNIDGLELRGQNYYSGSGGLSQAFLGASIKLTDFASIGVMGLAAFGKISNSIRTIFYDYYGYSSETLFEDYFSGVGYKAGIYLKPINNTGIGLFYESNPNLDYQRKMSYYSQLVSDSSSSLNLSTNLPSRFGLGLSYTTGKILVGFDYIQQDFSNFDYKGGPAVKFKNYSSISFGIKRLGTKSSSAELADRITYNIGFGYNQLYYNISTKDINEIYGSFGFEIPIVGTAILNSAITFGSRGTTENGLLKEIFGRLNIDVSIGEIWFKPYRRD
ncbi:MAG: hypothetical protein N2319_03180 [Candidatus Kapabacteria bacterium]|nr:hypothetical protein [Candidatus Kapabacteria bacterium]